MATPDGPPLSPSHSLSPELLAAVFSCHIKNLQHEPSSLALVAPWTKVTHVCRYWRDVAWSTGMFWQDIDVSKDFIRKRGLEDALEITKQMIARSCQAPLNVRARDLFKESDLEPLRLVLKEIRRILTLHVGLTPAIFRLFDDCPWYCSAPLLSSLHLTNHYHEDGFRTFVSDFQAPLLREMSLTRSGLAMEPMRWKKWPFPRTLTRLIIPSGFVEAEPAVVATAIVNLTLLEYLELGDLFHEMEDNHTSRRDFTLAESPASLPHLKELRISGPTVPACVAFVDSLRLPAFTRFRFLPHDNRLRSYCPSLLYLVDARLTGTPSPFGDTSPAANTLVLGYASMSFHHTAQAQDNSLVETPLLHLAYVYKRSSTHPSDVATFAPLVQDVVAHMPHRNITHLTIQFLADLNNVDARWRSLLGLLRNVESVTFHRVQPPRSMSWWNGLMSFILMAQLDEGGQSPMPTMPCLKRVKLVNVEMADGEGLIDVVQELCGAFALRRGDGCEIEELVLEGCGHVDAGVVKRFDEFVGTVTWDGYEGSAFKEAADNY